MSRDVSDEPGQNAGKTFLALTQEDNTGTYQLSISKEALTRGTEFLLSTSAIITTNGEPSFNGMLSRVVFFKRADGAVQLLESQKGASIEAALTRPSILATFPVVAEDDKTVGLSFNAGIESLLLASDWNSSDNDSPDLAFQDRFSQAKLTQRYVDEGQTDDKGRITIRQIAQVGDGTVDTAELRYFLQPYEPDPSYPTLDSNQDFRWSGYFESIGSLVPGTTTVKPKLSRFHPAKPLRYAISSNTPAEVHDAIREAILYWNRALGRDWIEVIDAPEGVTAPNLDYNVVQWVDERGAGAAYADAQLDPLTGEVRNAQIFMPSAFYVQATNAVTRIYETRVQELEDARAKAQQLMATANAAPLQAAKPADIARARWQGGCNLRSSSRLAQAEKALLKQDLSPEVIKRVALDYVRSTVAHEVGHTLGLRHNFAGSLGTNIAREEVDALVTNYFATGDWPADKVPGASVMEYSAFQDDVATGAHIRLGYPALEHDRLAINALYNGTPLDEGGPLFCTDSQLDQWIDCAQNDTGADVVASLRTQIKDTVNFAAYEYVRYLRSARAAERSDLFSATGADVDAANAYAPRAQLTQLLTSEASLLSVDRELGSPGINQKAIHERSLELVGRSIVSAGGYDPFLARLPDDFDERFNTQLDELLSEPWITSGDTATGGRWSFSESDIAAIRDYAPKYLEVYHEAAAKSDIAVLSLRNPLLAVLADSSSDDSSLSDSSFVTGTWEPPVLVEDFQKLLVDRAQYYATATSGAFATEVSVPADALPEEEPETPPQAPPKPRRWPKGSDQPSDAQAKGAPQNADDPGKPDEPKKDDQGEAEPPEAAPVQVELRLPIFKYATGVRISVAGILTPYNSADRIWLRELIDQPARALSSELDDAAKGSFDYLLLDGSAPEAQRWILDNHDVLDALGGAPQP